MSARATSKTGTGGCREPPVYDANLLFNGSLFASGDAYTFADVTVSFNNTEFLGCATVGVFEGTTRCAKTPGYYTLDLSNTTLSIVKTPDFTVPVGVPIAVSAQIVGTAAAGTYLPNTDGSASCSFDDTLSFAPTGPVFDLPPGFTVDSVDGQIVNNQWVGAETVTSAPEPSATGLFTIGGVLPGGSRMLRKRRPGTSSQPNP